MEKGLTFYRVNKYSSAVRHVDLVMPVQGLEKVILYEIWNSYGDNNQKTLYDVELTITPIRTGGNIGSGAGLVTNGYIQMKISTDINWTAMTPGAVFRIGNLVSNSKVVIEFRIYVPEGDLSIGEIGFMLKENGSSQAAYADYDGAMSFGYDNSNQLVSFDHGAVYEGQGWYDGTFEDAAIARKNQFMVLFHGIFISQSEKQRWSRAGIGIH